MDNRIFLSLAALTAGIGIGAPSQAQERFEGYYGGLAIGSSEARAEAGDLDAKSSGAALEVYGGRTFVKDNGLAWGGEIGLTGFGGDGKVTVGAESGEHKGGAILSAKGRVGYASDQLFLYGSLGLAATGGGLVDDSDDVNITITPVIGLGAEVAINDALSVRLDASRYDFSGPEFDFGAGDERVNQSVNVVSLGITRRF